MKKKIKLKDLDKTDVIVVTDDVEMKALLKQLERSGFNPPNLVKEDYKTGMYIRPMDGTFGTVNPEMFNNLFRSTSNAFTLDSFEEFTTKDKGDIEEEPVFKTGDIIKAWNDNQPVPHTRVFMGYDPALLSPYITCDVEVYKEWRKSGLGTPIIKTHMKAEPIPPKKMSIKQIEDALGHKVEVIY